MRLCTISVVDNTFSACIDTLTLITSQHVYELRSWFLIKIHGSESRGQEKPPT